MTKSAVGSNPPAVGSLVRWIDGSSTPATGVYLIPHDQTSNEPAARAVTPSNPAAADRRTRGAAPPSDRRFLKSFFDPRGPHFSIVGRGGTPPTDDHKNFSFLTF